MKKSGRRLEFTGERLIPEAVSGIGPFFEHILRYLFASQIVKNKIVLDAGSGSGYGSYILSTEGKAKKVYGVDNSKETIAYAKSKYKNSRVEYLVDDIENIKKLNDKSIHVVVAFELIEHLKNPQNFLKEVKRLLKLGGLFLVSTPNKNASAKNNPHHLKEFTQKEFDGLLKKYFKYISFYYQEFELVTSIKKQENTNFSFIKKFVQKNEKIYKTLTDPKNSQYFLCICSDVKLPTLDLIAMTTKKADGFDLTQGLLSLGEQFARQKKLPIFLKENLKKILSR